MHLLSYMTLLSSLLENKTQSKPLFLFCLQIIHINLLWEYTFGFSEIFTTFSRLFNIMTF